MFKVIYCKAQCLQDLGELPEDGRDKNWRILACRDERRYLLPLRVSRDMKTSHLHEDADAVSRQDSLVRVRRNLKEDILGFLSSMSCSPRQGKTCPRCGHLMEYIDTEFWLYGEEATWQVELPVCSCATIPRA